MAWQILSLHFKQQYDGAFRYLDRCGEFMIAAVEAMKFIPGEIKPTGAKLEVPESGLKATLDTTELTATQEFPTDNDYFPNICYGLATLVNEKIQPGRIIRNGFACKTFWPIADADKLLATSLQFGGDAQTELGQKLGFVPAHKGLDFNFTSGSMNLHVRLHPVTFERVNVNRHTASFNASAAQKERVARLNNYADRLNVPMSHALMLEVDLMEVDPPPRPLEKHFAEMVRCAGILKTQFMVK